MTIGTSERGFGIYADFQSTYGDQVRVYESSAASAPHVWVNLQTASEGIAAHLNVAQARTLRDALDEFLTEIPTRWADGQKFIGAPNDGL